MATLDPATLGVSLVAALLVDLIVFSGWWFLVRRGRNATMDGYGRWRSIIENRDGFPSLAKFQFVVWTAVVIPVFTFVYLVRGLNGVLQPIGSLPTNVLALLGISVVAVPVSDRISYRVYETKTGDPEADRELIRQARKASRPLLRTMLMESDQLSLARLQMFMWTFVAIAIYLFVVWGTFQTPATYANAEKLTLPDIDPALVVLMGLSQTGYIGSKATMMGLTGP